MKKTISVLLAVLMLFSVFAVSFSVFADEQPTCPACGKQHIEEFNQCECCVACPYISMDKVAQCAKSGGQVKPYEQFCCDQCTGLYNCRCGKNNPNCKCTFCMGGSDPEESELKPVVPQQTQLHIRELFQQILQKIAEVFDRMFEVAFSIFNVQ